MGPKIEGDLDSNDGHFSWKGFNRDLKSAVDGIVGGSGGAAASSCASSVKCFGKFFVHRDYDEVRV